MSTARITGAIMHQVRPASFVNKESKENLGVIEVVSTGNQKASKANGVTQNFHSGCLRGAKLFLFAFGIFG